MKKRLVTAVIAILVFAPTLATGQVVSSLAGLHLFTEQAITATAELVPEDLYGFQPTEEVRTLGRILAHVANSNFQICSQAAGEENPSQENFEETKTTKAAVQQALADGFAYCQGIYENMTDEKGAETIPFIGGQEMARAAVLAFNSTHSYEHYGNLVTYMRINGITPPTTMAAGGQ